MPKDDSEPYLIRVGWSLNYSSLQLGEEEFSFAYCNTGKICCDKNFSDYGETFDKGDSIGAYIVIYNKKIFNRTKFLYYIYLF